MQCCSQLLALPILQIFLALIVFSALAAILNSVWETAQGDVSHRLGCKFIQ